MDDDKEINDIIKTDQGFVSHVFNFDNKSKQDMMNIMQYAILAIFPVVLLNKSIQKCIPEADENKASLELIAEVIAQIGMIFIGSFFIHRVITYVPTYSEAKYETFSLINGIISFLIIVLSLQTKLGEKMSIITDRVLALVQGNQVQPANERHTLSEYSVPILTNNAIPNNSPNNQTEPAMYQPPPMNMEPTITAANESLGGSFGSSF